GVVLLATGLNGLVLAGSLDLPWLAVLHAGFILAGAAKALALLAILLLAGRGVRSGRGTQAGLLLLGAVVLAAALADSHAAARLEGKVPMFVASALHEAGAALWLGGLPCFALALRRLASPAAAADVGRRFSTMSAIGVGMILAGAVMISIGFIGSVEGVYGPA